MQLAQFLDRNNKEHVLSTESFTTTFSKYTSQQSSHFHLSSVSTQGTGGENKQTEENEI